jgi:hypothetical protein
MMPIPKIAIAIPRCWGGNVSKRIDWEMGCKAPPPIPCKTLKKMRLLRLHAEPQRKELIVNNVMENIR